MFRVLAAVGLGVLLIAFHGSLGLAPSGAVSNAPIALHRSAFDSGSAAMIQNDPACQQALRAAQASGAAAVTCAFAGFVLSPSP